MYEPNGKVIFTVDIMVLETYRKVNEHTITNFISQKKTLYASLLTTKENNITQKML